MSNKESIILGAHIDHLGHGEYSRPNSSSQNKIYPGADDNASGVAILLELAQQLSDLKAEGKLLGSKNIVFAIWSGEEIGVLGSSYFVDTLPNPNKATREIDAVINFDMVGRLQEKLIVQGIGSSNDWAPYLKKASKATSLKLIFQQDPYLPTDSTPFYLHYIPTLNLFSGAHQDYHSPEDTADKLNYQGMRKISDFSLQLVIQLIQTDQQLVYRAVGKKHHVIKTFDVYLGTIPDYAHQTVKGVQLSGVIKDSPAEKAGLKAKDIIIDVDQHPIRNIQDYAHALSTLHPHERFNVIIQRAQKNQTMSVIADAR